MSSDPLVVGRVIGDVLDDFAPTISMTVTYNNNKLVSNGHELFPSAVSSRPKVDIYDGDLRSFFTLELEMIDRWDVTLSGENCMTAEDAKIVTDIPGTTNSTFGSEIVSYEKPRPNIGIHRFVFVLFKQRCRQAVSHLPTSRDQFNVRNFAAENELGLPVAAVYFNAQRETAARRR
ncbi:hypothetical protein Leryth_000958 [Lithospermum erythrorhizon]|nr:hypothetical protein Leryth_000958 [Lithospermum erythrorhizon]